MTLPELLRLSAERHATKTALVFAEKIWTYQDLEEAVLRAAAGFREAGVKEGDRVVILSKNSPEFVFAIFALAHLGACALPVNFYLKPEEVAFICSDSGASAIVTQAAFLETVRAAQRKYPGLKKIWLTDVRESPEPDSIALFSHLLTRKKIEAPAGAKEDGTMLILYTSGTTGKPKGAMLTHGNLAANAEASAQALDLSAKDRFLCILPMFHVFAWTANVVVPLSLGCPVVLVESIRPPRLWLNLMSKHKTTIFAAVPQIFSVLAEQAKGVKKWVLKYLYFGHVRFCVSGAAPLQAETQKLFEDRIGLPLLEGYGLTETSPVVSVNTLKHRKAGSVGRPIPGVEIRIVDESEAPLPQGQEGEICIRGPNVMKGYYGQDQAQASRQAFTRDGWFKTGDVGLLDDEGFLHIRDRIKDMIIVKGLKVFSVQIEDLLLTHPDVAEAAVVGIPDASGDETIKGFVVAKEGRALDKAALMKLCQEKLPPYKRPRDIEVRKDLPKNALQKILKRELRNAPQASQEGTP